MLADDAPSLNGLPPFVKHSLPCIKCWYDLRTMRRTDRCSECGTPVSRTMRSLFAADYKYLRRLRAALALAGWGVAAGILSLWLVPGAAAMLASQTDNAAIAWLLMPLCLCGPVMTAIGLPMVGRAERRFDSNFERPPSVALTVWCWVFVGAVAIVLVLYVQGLSGRVTRGHSGYRSWDWVMLVACSGLGFAWLIRNATLSPFVRRTGRRLGLKRAMGRAGYIGLVSVLLWGVLFLFLMYDDRRSYWHGVVTVSAGVSAFVSAIWAIMRHSNDLGVISRRIKSVLRFRATNGKSGRPSRL